MTTSGSYYVTKWALTRGIVEIPSSCAEIVDVVYLSYREKSYPMFVGKPHWHETLEDAYAEVRKMTERKLASLVKQIDRMKRFDVRSIRVEKAGAK